MNVSQAKEVSVNALTTAYNAAAAAFNWGGRQVKYIAGQGYDLAAYIGSMGKNVLFKIANVFLAALTFVKDQFLIFAQFSAKHISSFASFSKEFVLNHQTELGYLGLGIILTLGAVYLSSLLVKEEKTA
ncbi:MAG: hypothetical protein A3F40_00850 [Chlamydiae bacterium RIFCSPHIGHO2_12_FULL_27_8]|nr:MAG: hypothetical protein A3F40_00850 [Chlamydiae bacterium RIFCSPHIGHO2_12_FULL_27_8]OGN65215.1 MAG: hypothetical protein A2888_03245 [Chlamydiae bacterium RIFCSPLOWO2_01_FULL_28_7]